MATQKFTTVKAAAEYLSDIVDRLKSSFSSYQVEKKGLDTTLRPINDPNQPTETLYYDTNGGPIFGSTTPAPFLDEMTVRQGKRVSIGTPTIAEQWMIDYFRGHMRRTGEELVEAAQTVIAFEKRVTSSKTGVLAKLAASSKHRNGLTQAFYAAVGTESALSADKIAQTLAPLIAAEELIATVGKGKKNVAAIAAALKQGK